MTRSLITTLADLRGRCDVDLQTGCWLWSGYTNRLGSAWVHFLRADGTKQKMMGRRAAVELDTGEPFPLGLQAQRALRCQHVNCVRPDHVDISSGDRSKRRERVVVLSAGRVPRWAFDWDGSNIGRAQA